MKQRNLDDLIDACLEDRLDEAEAKKLSDLLEESAEARVRYWEAASIHGLMEQVLQGASIKAATGQSPSPSEPTSISMGFSRLFPWRPLAAAAAGLMFGIFGASMVWAYAIPKVKGLSREKVTLLFESFEEKGISFERKFPTRSGEWFGDMTVVGPEPGVDVGPFKGEGMVKLTPVERRKFSYARKIIDVTEQSRQPDEQSYQLEVVASFAAQDSSVSSQYQIRLAAFSQSPSEIRPIWNDESVLFDTVLQHSGRNVVTEPGQTGWEKIRVKLDVPPGTRSLVISLGAADADPSQSASGHYLDAVRANLLFTPTNED